MEQMRQRTQLDMFEDINLLFSILTAVECNAFSCTGLFIDSRTDARTQRLRS